MFIPVVPNADESGCYENLNPIVCATEKEYVILQRSIPLTSHATHKYKYTAVIRYSPSGTTSPQPQPSNISCVKWLVLIFQCLDRENTGSLNTEHDSSVGETRNKPQAEPSTAHDNDLAMNTAEAYYKLAGIAPCNWTRTPRVHRRQHQKDSCAK